MALFTPAERRFAATVSQLIFCNPFLPERIELERQLLGGDFAPAPWAYHKVDDLDHEHPNLTALDERVEKLTCRARQQLAEGGHAADTERGLYADLATYVLYRRYREGLLDVVARGLKHQTDKVRVPYWQRFAADFKHFFAVANLPLKPIQPERQPGYLLACFFQTRRAFYQIYHHIAGASDPAVRLRASVWESIFTHNRERYFRLDLYSKMGRFPTLITGPSGSGKELVAKAIGLSRFIPFDADKSCFTADFAGSFHALNIAALASTLVESELFGHVAGAFTTALSDRIGWLGKCSELGTVFLDEIGELDGAIQVKLLRVLQERKFCRLGDTEERLFEGKIVAATNRDLAAEMHAGRFRQDFYFRLCADIITTPSLAEQLANRPNDLPDLIRIIVKRVTTADVDEIAGEVEAWIERHLGARYAWPGNFRELEQCVWNVMIRNEYHPARPPTPDDPIRALGESVMRGSLTADELERQYYSLVFAQTNNYQEAARHLGRNWQTVKNKTDHALVRQFRVKSRTITGA